MKITVGFGEEFGLPPTQVIESSDGNPIVIEGLKLTLSYHDGCLEIRADSDGYPIVRPVSGNVIEVQLKRWGTDRG